MRTQGGGGVKKRSNFADVLYGWPLNNNFLNSKSCVILIKSYDPRWSNENNLTVMSSPWLVIKITQLLELISKTIWIALTLASIFTQDPMSSIFFSQDNMHSPQTILEHLYHYKESVTVQLFFTAWKNLF